MRRSPLRLGLAAVALCFAPAAASADVVGNGTPASCTSAAVVAAVRAGGSVTFSCGPNPVTIQMTQTAKVVNTSPQVTIDGGGLVTLSGGGTNRILYMNTCDQAQVWTTSHCSQQATPQLTVNGLTFEDGDSTGGGATGGGAIYAFGGQLTIENSQFVDNQCAPATGSAVGGGAVDAVWQYDADPVQIFNSSFTGNVCDNPGAGGGGGAVFESQGPGLDVENSTFDDNTCVSTGPDVGGGAIRVFMGGTSPTTVDESSFTGNSCSNGAALSSIDNSWNVENSNFVGNSAVGTGANPAAAGTPGGGSGGAIYNDGNLMQLSIGDSTFQGNTANAGGGAVFFVSDNRTGTMSIASSRFCNNQNAGFQTSGLPGVYFLGAVAPTITSSALSNLTGASCALVSGTGATMVATTMGTATTGTTTSTATAAASSSPSPPGGTSTAVGGAPTSTRPTSATKGTTHRAPSSGSRSHKLRRRLRARRAHRRDRRARR